MKKLFSTTLSEKKDENLGIKIKKILLYIILGENLFHFLLVNKNENQIML